MSLLTKSFLKQQLQGMENIYDLVNVHFSNAQPENINVEDSYRNPEYAIYHHNWSISKNISVWGQIKGIRGNGLSDRFDYIYLETH